MKANLDKAGALGAMFAALAAATPCCLPLLATAGGALGLGFLAPYQTALSGIFQGFALLAVSGVFIAYRRHGQILPLLLAFGAAAAILAYYHAFRSPALLYTGIGVLVLASAVNHLAARRCNLCAP